MWLLCQRMTPITWHMVSNVQAGSSRHLPKDLIVAHALQ